MKSFQERVPHDDRVQLVQEIRARYPDRIPIICEPKQGSDIVIDKVKFLAPADFKMGHFIVTLRKRIKKMRASDAIYVFCNNVVAPSAMCVGEIYEKHKSDDGLLYLQFDKESTFG